MHVELTQEEENKIIEKVADFAVKKGVSDLMLLFLESVRPVSYVVFQITLFSTAPFLMLFGQYGDLGTKLMLLLQKNGSVQKLISRIREKLAEKDVLSDSAADKSHTSLPP